MADNKDKKVLNVPALRFPEFIKSWECSILEKLSKKIGDGIHSTPSYDDNGTFYFINGNNLNGGKIVITSSTKRVSEKEAYKNNAENLEANSILMSINGTIGNVALYHNEPIMLGKSACYINSKDNIDKNYLFYYLQYPKTQLYFEAELTGTTIKNLSLQSIRKTKIYIPTIEEQHKISRFLQKIDERISTQNKIIEKLETLIKGIRHKVFKQLRKDIGFNATIGNILSFEQPQRYIVSSAEYSNDDTFTPVLTANKAFILGYTTETDGIYGKGDCIIIDDFTLDCKYVSFPFKVKSSAIKILTAKNKFILRYAYEYLKSLELSTEEHKRHYIAEVQPHSCVLPDENTLKTIALVFENLACKLANEQSLVLIFNKQKQYLLSKMFI